MLIEIIMILIFGGFCLFVGAWLDWDKYEIKNRYKLVMAFAMILFTPFMFFEKFLFSSEPYPEWRKNHFQYMVSSGISFAILMFIGRYPFGLERAYILPLSCLGAYALGFTGKKISAKIRSKS